MQIRNHVSRCIVVLFPRILYILNYYDLMVVAVPKDMDFTEVEFHTTSVTLIG